MPWRDQALATAGATAVTAPTGVPVEEAARAVDLPAIPQLLAFTGVSAQARPGTFHGAVAVVVGTLPYTRAAFLAALVVAFLFTRWRRGAAALGSRGVVSQSPGTLQVLSATLTNRVSPGPAVMLLLPHVAAGAPDVVERSGVAQPCTGSSAGSLLLMSSIANLTVADLAKSAGVWLDGRARARVGTPIRRAVLWVLVRAWCSGT